MSYRLDFVVDTSGYVIARGANGLTLKSNHVEAHLMIAILEELRDLREQLAAPSPSPTPAEQL